ncbi:unnamed protein product [Didymodactylos carnosus]|uniref:Uncharacterized protein n=1 Tax=Didymodactylos carnosus TaxID=1234261 RepID=A0A813P3W3_9BILA|nr:unnamed protein product [Didymodactylos carnosus]CAF0743159.1 unnamed protein product [Didymodactylos carnosus]CAF3506341.1 unnamed protein product [Didymodactylos carnosus]CAF3521705.1 unnamed protein product [Didymodactylos carnosus]
MVVFVLMTLLMIPKITTKKERRSNTETKKNNKNSNLFEALPALVMINSSQVKMSSPQSSSTSTNGSAHESDSKASMYDTVKPTSVEINSLPSLNGNSNGIFENNTDNSIPATSSSKYVLKLKVGGHDENNLVETPKTTNDVNGHHSSQGDPVKPPLEPLIVREMPKESYNNNNSNNSVIEDLIFGTLAKSSKVSNGDVENENTASSTATNPSPRNNSTGEMDSSYNNDKNLGSSMISDVGFDSGLASSTATPTPSILPSDDDTSGSSISSVKLNPSTLKNINENDSSATATTFDTASISSSTTVTGSMFDDRKFDIDEPKHDANQGNGGVFQPEPSSVKDTVKVFEAALAAGNEQPPSSSTAQGKKASTMKTSPVTKDRPVTKGSNSFSSSDKIKSSKDQISPLGSSIGSSESFDTASTISSSSVITGASTGLGQPEQKDTKSKSSKKRPSLKKQIQHLLKIDKSSSLQHDGSHKQENVIQEEPITSSPSMLSTATTNRKANTLNSRNTKSDKRDKNGTDANETKSRTSPLHSPDSLNGKYDKDLSSMLMDEQKANIFKKRPSPSTSSSQQQQQQKRTSPRESVEKTQTTTKVTEFNMNPPISRTTEPLEIRISNDHVFTKKKSVSPSSTSKTEGLLQQNDGIISDKMAATSEVDGKRLGVSKLISAFQTSNNNQYGTDGNSELEQTILVPRLQRLSTSPDIAVSKNSFVFC